MTAVSSTPVRSTRVAFDEDVATQREDVEEDYADWFCIATRPFHCPRPGCDFVAHHQTGAHLIIVWPSIDDRHMLAAASNCKHVGRDPNIVVYQKSMGACIAYDEWVRIGMPVHGMQERPDGWEDRPNRL